MENSDPQNAMADQVSMNSYDYYSRMQTFIDSIEDDTIRADIRKHFENQYGLYLAKVFEYEWLILDNKRYILESETEYGESLALLVENISKSIILDGDIRELRAENELKKQKEAELLELQEKLESLNRELEDLSITDGLTGIANRRYFDKQLPVEWERAQRSGSSIAMLMIDIDYFKKYNDTYGHIRGDNCLKLIALTLTRNVKRAGDLIARYGGEEFVVILPNVNMENAVKIAERIRAAILDLKVLHASSDVHDFVSISIGVSSAAARRDISCIRLLENADRALYMAKEGGRNRHSAIET